MVVINTDLFSNRFRTQSSRLKLWDYSNPGYYFITICVKDKICCLSDIKERKVVLSKVGRIAEEFYLKIPEYFENVILDQYCIMPNHIHGIIVICCPENTTTNKGRDAINRVSTGGGISKDNNPMFGNSLSRIIRWYKGRTTFEIRKNIAFSWQSRFYDHIIRNEKSLLKIQEYIQNNPLNWNEDRENPVNIE